MTTIKMTKVIMGLGNPEEKFNYSPHNVGYHVVDHLAKTLGLGPVQHGTGFFLDDIEAQIWLAKPMSYMNASGQPIRDFIINRDCTIDNLLVVYDDLDLPLGKLRFRAKGSAGGHNGIKSIIEKLGTNKFNRLKVGVAPEKLPKDIVEYVLTPLKKKALEEYEFAVVEAADAVKVWIYSDIEEAAQHYNGKKEK